MLWLYRTDCPVLHLEAEPDIPAASAEKDPATEATHICKVSGNTHSNNL